MDFLSDSCYAFIKEINCGTIRKIIVKIILSQWFLNRLLNQASSGYVIPLQIINCGTISTKTELLSK